MPREKKRDDRDFDQTQLFANSHGRNLHRDYSAHWHRWSFARRFINKQHHVLDVGCGEERPLSRVLDVGINWYYKSYTGVDLNKLKDSGGKRVTLIGEFDFTKRWKELLKGDYKDGFDIVTHFEVIEHMSVANGRKLLKACFACLKPGGAMLMSTPCYDGVRHAANHIHEYTIPELEKMVVKAGFNVEKRFGTFMDIRNIGAPHHLDDTTHKAVLCLKKRLGEYYDNDALSCIFAPLYPDSARNNLWICTRRYS